MKSSYTAIFLNPAAGRGRASTCAAGIREIFHQEKFKFEWFESRAQGDIEENVRHAINSGADRIVVAGGDGSIHEAVNGMLGIGASVGLGIIPVGTGNDFAKACQISLQWKVAAKLLAKRLSKGNSSRLVDVGCVNERYFVNGIGIGLDAKINQIASEIRWPLGDLVYLVAVVKCISRGIATPSIKLRIGEKQLEKKVSLVSISNGSWTGGKFRIAPDAVNDDGDLDLVVVDPVTIARVVALLPKLMRGNHTTAPEVSMYRVQSLELTSDLPLPLHLDGENQPPQTEFFIRVKPAALILL